MDLVTYLSQELERRGMSQHQLAEASGVSRPHIGNVLGHKYKATADFCIAVAKGLGVDPVRLLVLGGHLLPPPTDTPDPVLSEIWRLASELPHERRVAARDMLRGLSGKG